MGHELLNRLTSSKSAINENKIQVREQCNRKQKLEHWKAQSSKGEGKKAPEHFKNLKIEGGLQVPCILPIFHNQLSIQTIILELQFL